MFAWVTAEGSTGVVFNLTRSVVEQQHHVPVLFIRDRQTSSEVAFTPGVNSSAKPDSVALMVLGIYAAVKNAYIFAMREPPFYVLHHGTNWGADLFPSLGFYRRSKRSVQIYPNPYTHLFSPIPADSNHDRTLRKWKASRVVYEHRYDFERTGGSLTFADLPLEDWDVFARPF
jgi:hypothetical protein